MFIDRDDILNLYVVTALPLRNGAIPEAKPIASVQRVIGRLQLICSLPHHDFATDAADIDLDVEP
jgi:hypothetical protein